MRTGSAPKHSEIVVPASYFSNSVVAGDFRTDILELSLSEFTAFLLTFPFYQTFTWDHDPKGRIEGFVCVCVSVFVLRGCIQKFLD